MSAHTGNGYTVDITQLLTAREAAKALGVSTATIYAWAKCGCLAVIKVGRLHLFERSAVEWHREHLEERRGS